MADSQADERQHHSSIRVTKRTDRSVRTKLMQNLIKPFNEHLIKAKKQFPAGSPQLEPPKKALKRCHIQERRVEEIYIYDFTAHEHKQPRDGANETKRRKRIYYFCGGGWQMPASSDHWALCAEMAVQLPNTVMSLVSYPLAPNSPAPVALPMLLKLYATLLRESEEADEDVILAGDSAGGNIVLCLTLDSLSREPDSLCPRALLVISPSTDLSRSNPAIQQTEKHDPLLRVPFVKETADGWAGDWDARDPRISPLYANVSPLARRGVSVYGITGSHDILGPDALLFREKLIEAGVEGEWLEWDGQMHCFPLTWPYKLPEGVGAKNWMLDVLRRC